MHHIRQQAEQCTYQQRRYTKQGTCSLPFLNTRSAFMSLTRLVLTEFSCLTVPICLQLFSRMHTYGPNQGTRTRRLFLNDLIYAQCMRFPSVSNHVRQYGTVQTFFHRSSRCHRTLASALNEACHKRQNPWRRKYCLKPRPFLQLPSYVPSMASPKTDRGYRQSRRI